MCPNDYQKKILELLADGEPAKVVAAKMNRDEKVVENEITKMRKLFRVPNTVALCVYAVRRHIIQ